MALTPVEIRHLRPSTGFIGYKRGMTDCLFEEIAVASARPLLEKRRRSLSQRRRRQRNEACHDNEWWSSQCLRDSKK